MPSFSLELLADQCKGCELCVEACPRDVLAMGSQVNSLGYRPATVIAPTRCTGCKACALVCPEVVFRIWKIA